MMVMLLHAESWSMVLVLPLLSSGYLLNDNNASDIPPFLFGGYSGTGEELKRREQAIFTTYKLDCCGNITIWGVDVHPGYHSGPKDRRGQYTIDFQVWRPSPTVKESLNSTGCYSLVGNNRFSAISNIVLPGVAIVTPSPQDYIAFQPEDVLGVFVEEASLSNDGVVMLTTRPYTDEVIWYGSIPPSMATSQHGGCPYLVGEGGVLNTLINAAGVISIETMTFPCPIPTTSSDDPFLASTPLGLTIGASLAVVLVTIVILVVILLLAVCLKRRTVNENTQVSATHLTNGESDDHIVNDQGREIDEEYYDYPVVDPANVPEIELTLNVSYGVGTLQEVVDRRLSIDSEDAYYNSLTS